MCIATQHYWDGEGGNANLGGGGATQAPTLFFHAAQHYWGGEGGGANTGNGGGEGGAGAQAGVAKAVGVTKLMKQCTAMLRERMGDRDGASSSEPTTAAARCATLRSFTSDMLL